MDADVRFPGFGQGGSGSPASEPSSPSALISWLGSHMRNAPRSLRDRVSKHAHGVPELAEMSGGLAGAAQYLLAEVVAHPGDRSVALDLLAADGLITLALLAQAETAPEHLEELASRLLSVDLTAA